MTVSSLSTFWTKLRTPLFRGNLTYQLSPLSFIQRHVVGDWGDICAEDRQVNADALQYGSRLMSVYAITPTETLWIITEADRSCTTLLLPQEY